MIIVNFICAFVIAAIFSNFVEWFSHRYVLHGLGKRKNSWFHYHWNHHLVSRKNDFYDKDYELGFFKSAPVRREIYALLGILAVNSYWLWIWPMFYYCCIFFTGFYWFCHQYSHLNKTWCKKWLSHHYDHHMGKDQDLNWCVTFPLWDNILGTRMKYNYDSVGKLLKEITEHEYWNHSMIEKNNFTGIVNYDNGTKMWYCRGKIHNVNGPAVIHHNGIEEYWVDDKPIPKEDFELLETKTKLFT
jgi:sterol desaturase/sphingolipid hydroxylase (fatty acid hydroxylase superfamily)